jgi:hypothetical protein
MIRSEDGGASVVKKLPDVEKGVGLEIWKYMGAMGAGWQTWNGHQASMDTVDNGAIGDNDGLEGGAGVTSVRS